MCSSDLDPITNKDNEIKSQLKLQVFTNLFNGQKYELLELTTSSFYFEEKNKEFFYKTDYLNVRLAGMFSDFPGEISRASFIRHLLDDVKDMSYYLIENRNESPFDSIKRYQNPRFEFHYSKDTKKLGCA